MKKIPILLAGLPGKMATLVAKRLAKNPQYELIPYSLTGPDVKEKKFLLDLGRNSEDLQLIKPNERNEYLRKIKCEWPSVIVVDFTQPDAIWQNCRDCVYYEIPFVMGTTGFTNEDRNLIAIMLSDSEISAVIATNMSVPIVMLMDMFAYAAENYPGALQNCEIRIVESHQVGKKDVSGTALAIGALLKKLGVNFTGKENIHCIRDVIEQRIIGIPEFAITGHGHHKYSIISQNRNFFLGFEHNIDGREAYVDGTLLAIDFLAKKIKEGSVGQCFSMRDVIKKGSPQVSPFSMHAGIIA